MIAARPLDDVQRAQILAGVAEAVAQPGDTGGALRRAIALIVPRLADWCVLDVRDGATVCRTLVVHGDPGRQARTAPLLGAWTPEPAARGVAAVLRTGRPHAQPAGAEPAALLPRRDARLEDLVADLGVTGYVSLPLRAPARTLGALTLVSAQATGRLGEADLRLARTIGGLLGLVLAAAPPDAARLARQQDLLAALSHQLRTPLTAVLAWLRLARQAPDPAVVARAHDAIERNGRALGRLVNDLLDTACVLAGGVPLTRAPVDLAALVAHAVERLAPDARTRGVRLETEVDHTDAGYVGDRARLEQVVALLLANAVKFTPPGGRVLVRLEADAECAAIRVIDSGCGIAAGDLPYVLEPFPRGASDPGGQGLGLGLALARGLVEAHGGHVEVASDGADRGAAFTVILPRPTV